MLPVSNLCLYHCSRTNYKVYVSKNLYENLDFYLAANQYIKLQLTEPGSCCVSNLVHFVHYTYTYMFARY